MYLNAKEHPESRHHILIDLEAAKLINRCIWADDKTGKYCVYDTDENSKYLFETDDFGRMLTGINQQPKTKVKHGKIRFVNLRL